MHDLVERQDFYRAPKIGWMRLVVEKPIGNDLTSARELNHAMSEVVSESQIYRIDHYLGKETVQNAMAFRFANVLFEPVWNRHYVDHMQITVAESLGVENRGAYYEEAGAVRDMVQSHMLQLLSIVAMEPPAVFRGNAVRDEKVKVLRSVIPPTGTQVQGAHRPRAVCRGIRRRQTGARLPAGGGGQPDVDDRDVRGDEAARRQLALGRCARSICAPASGCHGA